MVPVISRMSVTYCGQFISLMPCNISACKSYKLTEDATIKEEGAEEGVPLYQVSV